MKPSLGTAILIGALLLASTLNAATQVEATLALPHDHVLPGVPFDIVVTFTNVSNRPVVFDGAQATLVLTFSDGKTSVMDQPDVMDQWSVGPPFPLRLAPGESTQQSAGWESGGIPNWFIYESFAGPGTYGIALDLRIVDEEENLLGAVRTPTVEITRIEPVGIDAALWKRMQAMSGGRWSAMSFSMDLGAALSDEIVQLHPASGYYPYILALRALQRVNKNHIPALLEAAERFTDSPARPYLLKAAADCARYEALTAERARDEAAAQKYYKLAERNYHAALATKSVVVRAGAEKGLRDVAKGLDRTAKRNR